MCTMGELEPCSVLLVSEYMVYSCHECMCPSVWFTDALNVYDGSHMP